MNKKLLSVILAVVLLVTALPLSAVTASAAVDTEKYEAIEIASGYNRDVIAESAPVIGQNVNDYYYPAGNNVTLTFATQSAIKSMSDASYSTNYLNGFPDDGIVECDNTNYPGLYWKLGSYTQNNALCMRAYSNMSAEGTLVFEKIGCYRKLYIMAAAVGIPGGTSVKDVVVNYTDGTSSTTTCTFFDHGVTPEAEVACVDAINYHKYAAETKASVCPITVTTSKLIKSISFKSNNEGWVAGFVVFAVTGEVANIHPPVIKSATNTSCTSFTASWEPVADATSYVLDVATDPHFANILADNNNKSITSTSSTVTGLTPGQTYYYRVRSVGASGEQSKSSEVESVTPSHTWRPATVDAPKTCIICDATEGDKLPAIHASYVDPVTGETVEVATATNDHVQDVVKSLVSTPVQVTNNVFLGWHTHKGALDRNTTRFDETTQVTGSFAGITPLAKDKKDKKEVTDYMSFELVGVQIREENTIEKGNDEDIYGGLRYIACLGNDLYNSLDMIEYGFVVASKANADKNAAGNPNYVIKNGDKNVKRLKCSDMRDHRTFANYRLFTFVIDYEGSEGLKDEEFVVRPYIAYRDANGTARIFYGSYRGTVVYGGCSVSYNRAAQL